MVDKITDVLKKRLDSTVAYDFKLRKLKTARTHLQDLADHSKTSLAAISNKNSREFDYNMYRGNRATAARVYSVAGEDANKTTESNPR